MRSALSLSPSYYEALKRLTLELAGVNLGSDHAFLVETRLSTLARNEGYESLNDMIEELFKTGQSRLAVQVVSRLLERDTHFYTDPGSFDQLRDIVVPRLHESQPSKKLRILSFGCASGQEVYCIAMVLDKAKKMFPKAKFDITGVDYPSQSLERAQQGIYTHFEVQRGLPIRDLVNYFEPHKEDWKVKKSLRDKVKFEETHLLSNLDPLGQFDIVIFRNNLPHYSSPAQVRVLRGLAALVKPHGCLMLATDETLNSINYGFDPLEGTTNLFIKREEKVEEVIDPSIKQPNGRTTFEKSKRIIKDMANRPKKSAS